MAISTKEQIQKLEQGSQLVAVYEYRCKKCSQDFEIQQKISEEPLEACPSCGDEEGFAKLISLSSFACKGPGWFKSGGY